MKLLKKHSVVKILFLVLIATSLFCGFFISAVQGKSLEINYPQSPIGTPAPATTETSLPILIKYVFEYSVIFSLILTLLLLIFASFKYISSMGNADKVKDAKDRILSALLGASILFFSYLILSTIDPTILQTDFSLPSFNIQTEEAEPFKITNNMDFEQIPISYLVLNRFLGIENSFTQESPERSTKKIRNDSFGQNRIDNIWNWQGLDIDCNANKIPAPLLAGQDDKYYGVSNYTLFIAEQIKELAINLENETRKCTCQSRSVENGRCETGGCYSCCAPDSDRACREDERCSCKSYCACHGEPCSLNRGKIRQIQTDLTWLTIAFQIYINDGWVAEWINGSEECFIEGKCKRWAEEKDCNIFEDDKCFVWEEETKNISEGTKYLIYQIAKTEQLYGGLGEVLIDLQTQKEQIETAIQNIYNYSNTYLEKTPFGFYWAEPIYKFFNAGFEEYENSKLDLTEEEIENQERGTFVNHSNWEEAKNELMKINEENQKFCEKTLNGTWTPIAENTQLSLRAVCSYTQEFTSADFAKDPINNWVIFYKSVSPITSHIQKNTTKKSVSIIREVKAFEGMACTQNNSAKVPVGEAMRDSFNMVKNIADELEKIKEISQLVITTAIELKDLPDACKGSSCSTGMWTQSKYCLSCCKSIEPCEGCYSRCNKCGCSSCSGSPCPAEEIERKVYLISLLIDNDGPLLNRSHTREDCLAAGGEVVDSDVDFSQCRFTDESGASCPEGWAQYKNYSTTIPTSKRGQTSWIQGWCTRTDCNEDTCLYTVPTTHSWANRGQEYCAFCHSTCPPSCSCSWSNSVWSIKTQIGCY